MNTTLNRRTFGTALAGLMTAPLLASRVLAQDAPTTINIGSTAPGHLKFNLFRNLGLLEKEFAAEGIKIELVLFDGGSAAAIALGSGALDVMYTGNNPALRLAATGADVLAVGLSSWNPLNDTTIIAKADSPIKGLADLKGKNVAYLAGTVRHSNFTKALATVGLTIADLQSFNFAIDVAGPALDRGDIDAIVDTTSTVQPLIDQGFAKVIFDANEHPEWVSPFPISVNGEWARKYPTILARLLAVDIETAAWADANPAQTIDIFVKETGRSLASVQATYPKNLFYQQTELTQAAIDALKGEEAFMKSADLLEGKVDYAKWVDQSYYQAALALLPARKA